MDIMGVFETCSAIEENYIAPIFLMTISDISNRKTLNLKRFNDFVPYEHFKMENLKNCVMC